MSLKTNMEDWSQSIILHDEDLFLALVYTSLILYFPVLLYSKHLWKISLKEFNFNKISSLKPAILLTIELLHRHFSIVFSVDVEQLFCRKPPSAYFCYWQKQSLKVFFKIAVPQSIKLSVWGKSLKTTRWQVDFY